MFLSAEPPPEVTMPSSFEVEIERPRPGSILVRLSGEFDLCAFDEVDGLLVDVQADGVSSLVVDLRQLSFIDSTGIRVLLRAHERAKERGHELRIVRADPSVQRIFALTDLDGRLPFCDPDESTPIHGYPLAPPDRRPA